MRGFCGARLVLALAAASCVAACLPTTRTPARLYPLPVEIANIAIVETDLAARYYGATSAADAKTLRNEIVAQRMYAVDLQYTDYEAALTRESQEVGFGALTAAGGLTTASTLVASAATKTVLSAVATAVLGTKSHYESEVLLAQTIRTIQKQMRASRNIVAANIAARITQDVALYPLPAALSDVEDYYNAGTLTTGVIDTSTTVGVEELQSKDFKQAVTHASPAMRAAIVRNAVIESATVPMAAPAKLGDRNPEGLSNFERKATALQIQEMEVVTCQSKTGKITDALRKAVLGKVKRPNGTAITNPDFVRIDVEFNAISNGSKTVQCN